MRKLWLLAPITLPVLLNLTNCRAQSITAETSSPAILPANTSVILRLTKSLYKKDAKPGQPLEFEVAYDVVLNGQTLIERGISVAGSFRGLDRTGKGPAKVLIDLGPTQTVSGETVRLAPTRTTKTGNQIGISDAVLVAGETGPLFPAIMPVVVVVTLFQKKVILDKDAGAGWFSPGGLFLVAHVTETVALDPARQKAAQEQYTAKQKVLEAELQEWASTSANNTGQEETEAQVRELLEFPFERKAKLLHQAGDLDGAMAEYQQALILAPANPEPHLEVAGLFREKGDLVHGVAEYRAAVQLPAHGENWYVASIDERARIGLIETLTDAGDIDSALAEVREAIRLRPERSYFHYLLGRVLVKKIDPDAAIPELQRALKTEKNHLLPANCELGRAFELKGDPKAALHQYAIAVRAHGGDKECHAAYERLHLQVKK